MLTFSSSLHWPRPLLFFTNFFKRKKSWSWYLTPNIFPSSFDIRRYHLCKLNICVSRLFFSSSVTKGFPCSNGVRTGATRISAASSCPVAFSSVNPVSQRNIATCRSAWSCTSVGCRTGNPGGARVLFVVCQAEEWSCHIFLQISHLVCLYQSTIKVRG